MKILHTESSLGWGGQENRILSECKELSSRSHECVIACPATAQLFRRGIEAGLSVHPSAMRSGVSFSSIRSLAQIIRSEKPQIVNTHSSRDTILAGLAVRLLSRRIPVVRTRHIILPITNRVTYSHLCDHVVTVSNAVREQLISQGIEEKRISVVTTGVDQTRFDPLKVTSNLKADLGFATDTILVGTIAVMRAMKGHSELLKAAIRVSRDIPNIRFVFVGEGPQLERIKREVDSLGLDNRVYLLGMRSDIPYILRGLDLFVLPTRMEALGTAFLEAQAMGVPVVGTRVGGVPEAILENESGLLVELDDIEGLSNAIARLATDKQLRLAMGAVGRSWIRLNHTREIMAQRMVEVYEKLTRPSTRKLD